MVIPIDAICCEGRIREVQTKSEEFKELKESIRRHGLLQAITVREGSGGQYHLICGAHRLQAYKELLEELQDRHFEGIPATVVNIQEDEELLLCELEENIRRKALTWQEETLSTGTIYNRIKKNNPEFTVDDLSLLLQQSRSKVFHNIDMFEHRLVFPAIFTFGEWSRAREELRRLKVAEIAKERLERQSANRVEVEEQEEKQLEGGDVIQQSNPIPDASNWIFPDALQLLNSLEDNSVDIICTDPPFGINIQWTRKRRKGTQVYSEDYKDSEEEYFDLITPCMKEFARVLKPGSHLYMFFGIQQLGEIIKLLEKNKFLPCPVPIIWHRQGAGAACSQPYYLPASAYQAIIFAFAPGERKRLTKQGKSNVITLPAVPANKKVHPLEIPSLVYGDLISRSSCPGDLMVDPFCGTGNSLVGAMQSHCRVLGAEKREDYRHLAVLNVQERLNWERKINESRSETN